MSLEKHHKCFLIRWPEDCYLLIQFWVRSVLHTELIASSLIHLLNVPRVHVPLSEELGSQEINPGWCSWYLALTHFSVLLCRKMEWVEWVSTWHHHDRQMSSFSITSCSCETENTEKIVLNSAPVYKMTLKLVLQFDLFLSPFWC